MFSIVIIKKEGIVSRPAGDNLQAAIARAEERVQDFPEAIEIRVVSSLGIQHSMVISDELIKEHNNAREERIRQERLYSFYSSSY